MGIFPKRTAGQAAAPKPLPPPPAPPPGPSFRIIPARRTGSYNVDVVGESHHAQGFAAITGNRPGEIFLDAVVIREPDNPRDRDAVRVDVNRHQLGYIPHEHSVSYHALLDHVTSLGAVLAVSARIWTSPATPRYWSITLDMPPPSMAIVVNDIPRSPDVWIWPEGRKLKVSISPEGMAGARAVLARAYSAGRCAAWFELRHGTGKVAVLYDGIEIGTLSAQTSKKIQAVLGLPQMTTRRVFAVGEVTGNTLVANISLLLQPPEEVPQAQINALLQRPSS